MEEITFKDFQKVDIRTGTILEAKLNPKARNPAYVMKIDFGSLGVKTSSAQITDNYDAEDLIGMQIVAVVNFPDKNIAGIESEVLVLGAMSDKDDVVLLNTERKVEDGILIG